MALTQISTAGVKDDAVTAGKIPANAVGSSEIAANAVGSSELADNAVDTAAIADDAVTAAKIANNTITATQLNTDAVDTDALQVNSVTTAKLANDSVTSDKIPDNAVQNEHIADNSVGSDAIANGSVNTLELADQAVTLAKLEHGTSSNNGKFLRANNGADPTFETVTGTTINNNADNRVITGSGTANTLNGEANATFTGIKLNLGPYDGGTDVNFSLRNTNSGGYGAYISGGSGTNYVLRLDDKDQNQLVRFNANGDVGINTGTPESKLAIKGTSGQQNLFSISDTTVPTSGGEYGVAMIKTNTSNRALNITNYNTAGIGLKIYNNGGATGRNALECYQAGGTRFIVNEDVTVSTGNLVIGTAGKGIDFSAAADVASNETVSSSVLNDYEEGSWNPRIQGTTGAGTASYNAQTGRYTKIGNLVYLTGELNWTGGSAGGEMQIGNLPFAPGTDCEGIGNMMGHVLNIGGDTANISVYVGSGNYYSYLYQTRQGHQSWNTLNYDNDGAMIFNVQFRVS